MTFYIGAAIPLADTDFARLAAKHGIEEAALRAVVAVETGGKGFTSSGALICLYEPHVAYRNTSGSIRNALVKAGLAYAKWGAKPYPKSSYPRIDQCAKVAGAEVACLATSWGLPQMLGENHTAAGYSTGLEMVKDFAVSETNQIEGMIRFIKANPRMLAALKSHDWATFARLYNGAGYKRNAYDTKLALAYRKAAAKIAARPAPSPAPVEAPKSVLPPQDNQSQTLPSQAKPEAPKAQPSPAPVPSTGKKSAGTAAAIALGAAAVWQWGHDLITWIGGLFS